MSAETIQAACENAIRTSRRGETRAGIDLARHAYRLARRESPDAELEALNASALCQAANGSFIESIATAIDAIGLARQLANRRAATEALITMAGAASFILDANSVVLEMLSMCRSVADELGDEAQQVRIHNTFGLVYGNLARFDEADQEYDQGLALVNRADARAKLYTPAYLISGNRAFLSVQRARAAKTEEFPHLAADAEERIQHVLGVANAEMNIDAEARALFCLGQLRTLQGQNEAALQAFGEALVRATQIRHHPRLIDTNIEIGKLYASELQFERALEAMEQAYEFADASRPTAKVAVACEGIAAMYARLGRTRETAHYQAKTEREQEAFARDNEYAVRDLNAFWRTQAAAPAQAKCA
jgi:tetratricopeptide (TPR) repeat protein